MRHFSVAELTVIQLEHALDLHNQETAARINDRISRFTEETNDHSASVKWITLLTLLYLPASFVSVSVTPIKPNVYSDHVLSRSMV